MLLFTLKQFIWSDDSLQLICSALCIWGISDLSIIYAFYVFIAVCGSILRWHFLYVTENCFLNETLTLISAKKQKLKLNRGSGTDWMLCQVLPMCYQDRLNARRTLALHDTQHDRVWTVQCGGFNSFTFFWSSRTSQQTKHIAVCNYVISQQCSELSENN